MDDRKQGVLVIDFGSQTTLLIARRIRDDIRHDVRDDVHHDVRRRATATEEV